MLTKALLSLLAALLVGDPAFAWDDSGHETVAQIALDTLQRDPATLQAVKAIVDRDPRKGDADHLRGDLVHDATWPDRIKHRGARDSNIDPATQSPKDPNWHFVDIPYGADERTIVSFLTNSGKPVDPADDHSANVVTGIAFYRDQMKGGGLTDLQKADALAWLAHLVGDVHQPLHCMNVPVHAPLPNYAPPPDGDKGGNGFKIVTPNPRISDLHAYWDHQLDLVGRPLTPEQIQETAREIEKSIPMTSVQTELSDLNPADWARESYAFHQEVYTKVNLGETPSATYASRAQEIARRRLALAGYRLALLLKSALSR